MTRSTEISPGTIVQITDDHCWYVMMLGVIVRACPPANTWHEPNIYYIVEIDGKRLTVPCWAFSTDIGPTQ
jgi:hypothetical protein